jgi:hypothetical protein
MLRVLIADPLWGVLHLQVGSEAEAVEAFKEAKRLSDHFIFIEILVDKRDAAPASAALRQGFMARHFSSISGYKHLNLGASLAGGSDSLTAGHDGCASVGAHIGAARSGSPTSVGGAVLGGALAVGAAVSACEGRVLGGAGEARGMHHAAGSSTCLVAVGEAHLAASAGAQGVGAEGGVKHSRLGLVPAKRAAEGEAEYRY